MKKILVLVVSHAAVLAIGVGLGIYRYTAEFRRNLKGSDALHWGEGQVAIGPDRVALMGRIAPGPAYRLYLVPEFVETEADFKRVKAQSLAVADIRTFENFILPLPPGTPLERYTSVVIWCESFSQFITAGKYR